MQKWQKKHTGGRRQKWTPDEEKIMREELEITPGVAVPTRKFCQDILNKYPSQFSGKGTRGKVALYGAIATTHPGCARKRLSWRSTAHVALVNPSGSSGEIEFGMLYSWRRRQHRLHWTWHYQPSAKQHPDETEVRIYIHFLHLHSSR